MNAPSRPQGPAAAGPGRPGYLIRPATAEDLEAIAGFEVEIARVSFGDEAITDAALHYRRVAGALGKQGEITLVAVADTAPGRPLGWAWLSSRTNSLTGARYGNFRSLAVADVPGRSEIGELLLAAVLRAAADGGMGHLTGKVHAGNLGMRTLYRKFGFKATHITMEKREAGPGDGAGAARPGKGAPGEGAGGEGEGAPGGLGGSRSRCGSPGTADRDGRSP
jgi:L-amino acid N-acyltransferase YncA